MEAIERYLKDHAEEYTETLPPVSGDLRLCIVIPALAERQNIGAVLDSPRIYRKCWIRCRRKTIGSKLSLW
jgi:hypothetical protein